MKLYVEFSPGEVEDALSSTIGQEVYDSTFDPDIEIIDFGKNEEGKHWAKVEITQPIGEPR